jgi:hypothetical protein
MMMVRVEVCVAYTAIFGCITVRHNELSEEKKKIKDNEKQDLIYEKK